MKFGTDGQLYAVNPEAGFFGVAPGTGMRTNPNAIDMISKDTIFTNVARTDDGDIWWEGMTGEPPDTRSTGAAKSGRRRQRSPRRIRTDGSRRPRPVSVDRCGVGGPNGVPISAILFGGRRATVVPLVHEAHDWEHGVFLGAIMSSETTAAQAGEVGKLRFDPMAMLPFCGYHMGDYFGHWLRTAEHDGAKMPRVFYVNWFRKDEDGKFMWPGFGENSRVLAWVFERVAGRAQAIETPIGLVPPVGDGGIDTSDLDVADETMARLLEVDTERLAGAVAAGRSPLRRVRLQAAKRAQRAAARARVAPAVQLKSL